MRVRTRDYTVFRFWQIHLVDQSINSQNYRGDKIHNEFYKLAK